MKKLILFLLVATLAACANTKADFRVDGSSATSTEKSVVKINRALNERQRLEFAVALMRIQLSDMNSVIDLLNNKSLQSTNYAYLATKINGLTYQEIMDLAQKSEVKIETRTN
ncbi:MAG: DUF6694 family lipoprotein [Chromatiaceae bacterium]|jgi:hypothetical protein